MLCVCAQHIPGLTCVLFSAAANKGAGSEENGGTGGPGSGHRGKGARTATFRRPGSRSSRGTERGYLHRGERFLCIGASLVYVHSRSRTDQVKSNAVDTPSESVGSCQLPHPAARAPPRRWVAFTVRARFAPHSHRCYLYVCSSMFFKPLPPVIYIAIQLAKLPAHHFIRPALNRMSVNTTLFALIG